jgi:hypothetical protein
MDSAKLSLLVEKLCCALDSQQKRKPQFAAASRNESGPFVSD